MILQKTSNLNSKVNTSFLSMIILRSYGKQNSCYLPSTVSCFRMQSIREGQIVIISWSNKELNGLLEPLRKKYQQLSTLLQNDNN